MRLWGSTLAALLGLATVAQAASLDLRDVSADAKWLAHVNVDVMRDSVVVRNAYCAVLEKCPAAENHFVKARDEWGMDPRTDLHGMTFYGSQIGKHEGILILKADVDQKKLEEKAEKAPEHKASKHGDVTLHSWIDRHDKRHEHRVWGAFFKSDVLVFAASEDELKKALDVLAGKAPSLEGKDSPLAGKAPEGATVVARLTGLAEADLPVKSPLVKQTERICLAMGENQGESFFDGRMVAKTKEVAEQVKAVVEGGRAMALLQHGSDAAATKLISAMKVEVNDATVTVTFRAPAEEVWAQVAKHAQEMAEHHKRLKDKDKCAPKKDKN
jgi:hypothetical protein